MAVRLLRGDNGRSRTSTTPKQLSSESERRPRRTRRRARGRHISNESLIVILLVGVIAGWLAGQLVSGTGFGLIGDLIIGVIGAFIGSWLLPQLGTGRQAQEDEGLEGWGYLTPHQAGRL
jgi:uncharacterized membrane protein YeaQ/YmgE (transglycosylase-associated protein family)